MCNELNDNLGVRSGLEISAVAFKLGANRSQIYEIAVMRDSDQTLCGLDADWLIAIAIRPFVDSTRIGCAFSSAESPVVE